MKALCDYAAGLNEKDDALPVREKQALFDLLDEAIAEGLAFCTANAVPLHEALAHDDVFVKLGRFNGYADTLLATDELSKSFNVYENTITALYEAGKPEVLGLGKTRTVSAFQYLRGVIDAVLDQTDVQTAVQRLGQLLDQSVVVDPAQSFKEKQFDVEYRIVQRGKAWNLSTVDVEQLRDEFKQAAYKHIAIADLRSFIEKKLADMLAQNATRIGFAQRLQAIIDAYNAGATATEDCYAQLTAHVQAMQEEAERHVREGLSEDELELFDLLKKDAMTQDETQRVKLAAQRLLKRLVEEQPKVLVQDWFKDQRTQRQVRSEIERVLDQGLPETYERALFKQKCDNVFDLAVDHANRGRKWAA